MNAILSDSFFLTLLVVAIVLLICLYVLYGTFKSIFSILYPTAYKERAPKKQATVYDQLTDYVPVEEEHTILMDHEYDGIRELDNNLPPWWVYMFYVCIVFAISYLVYFHMMGGASQKDEYVQAVEKHNDMKREFAAAHPKLIDESNVSILDDAVSINSGKTAFEKNCQTCHAKDGIGSAGPNLTDEFWLYGGSAESIFATIKYGKIEKGMPNWAGKISSSEMQQVMSYIKHLKYVAPPIGKDPQGEKFVEQVLSDSTVVVADTLKK